jgi:hypothetical protein
MSLIVSKEKVKKHRTWRKRKLEKNGKFRSRKLGIPIERRGR